MSLHVLLSFVGNRDPYVDNDENIYGPVLSLLEAETYSRVYLICTGPDYFERAKMVETIAEEVTDNRKFNFIDLDLESVIDYEEIYGKLNSVLGKIRGQLRAPDSRVTVLLDPGTPQMQTVWFLLANSGEFPARLVQGIPARFAGGAYKVREVKLDGGILPDIVMHQAEGSNEEASADANGAASDTGPDNKWIRSSGLQIVAGSPAMLEILEQAKRVSRYDTNILIRGETGSGKGVVSKFIHQSSSRNEKPMVEINCPSIPSALVESELFGHKKGAFTGADSDRMGKFRTADGGTVFLDEIGDLPPEIQPKLLKVIEEKSFSPVGSDETVTVDIRVIAATNQNLEELIDQGRFRRDLYERINETHLELPPLRERESDILELGRYYLGLWNRQYGESREITPETWDYLQRYSWPGNIRELQNAVKSMCAKTASNTLTPGVLPSHILKYFNEERALLPLDLGIPDDGIDVKAFIFELEKSFYEEALMKAGGNGEKAAQLLGIKAPAFRKACRERFGLSG